ncbi:bifunctional riboflavin kinase/FAD synthetase [Falsarthrobacter nasiphocae]|uniref:Riboflavin biosynthesis protein n=1 Tax=Falsarthrobacter nasiphocae TaxID=189863 RepID=A0AAE4C7L3_9MICC|nr:bifunctional riboflavin kinase/FAD synthetase [Falsarthrobacter nasiphocae]MDR6892659.1 riboflavin kinase/FMN adenylyltransferase [Falsarthrobacter nasiphocae]
MQYFEGLDALPEGFGPSVVTLGNFDGVHRGHQRVLAEVLNRAERTQATSVALTFDPHPATVHRPDQDHSQIMALGDKVAALDARGLDAVVVIPYSLEFAAQSPEEFVSSTFVGRLNAACVVVGPDMRFGAGNSGDVRTLTELGSKHGFEVVVVDEYEAADGDGSRRCSSTWIRSLLAAGDVERAAEIIGAPHRVSATVVHGFARGRELGFPTANLAPEVQGLIPGEGVYAGWLTDEAGERWPAAISVGRNPTFDGVKRVTVEAHVLGRPEGEDVESFNLYGQHVSLEFVHRLRGMVAFQGIDLLVAQISEDVARAKALLDNDAASGRDKA